MKIDAQKAKLQLKITTYSFLKAIEAFTIKTFFAYLIFLEGTRHFVMWYTYWPPEITEEEINQDIANAIVKRLGPCEYEFVWYENPKMTIPGIYHVQVFWRVRK